MQFKVSLALVAFVLSSVLAIPVADSASAAAKAAGASPEVVAAIEANNKADPAYKYNDRAKRDSASEAAKAAGASAEVVAAVEANNNADLAYIYGGTKRDSTAEAK